MNVTYANLIPYYPDIKSKNFQTKITAKKEFNELASKTIELPPKPGEFYLHQQWILRYMKVYDKIFMMHEAGTGKTAGYSLVADYYSDANQKSAFVDALVDYYRSVPGLVKHVYILVKGRTLVKEVTDQIVCKLTQGKYLTEGLNNKEVLDKKKFREWFTVMTYTTFVNDLERRNITTDERIKKEFQGCLIICDEIHSIRNELIDEQAKDVDSKGLQTETLDELDESEKSLSATYTKKEKQYARVYAMLWRVCHVPNIKTILASATPMINEPNELIDEINLLLPEDKQISKDANIRNFTLEDYRYYFMGYISFVRAGDTGVEPIFQGRPLDTTYGPDNEPSQMIVYRSKMSSFQEQVYLEVYHSQNKGFRPLERQASMFVFPDKSYGGRFIRSSIDTKGKSASSSEANVDEEGTVLRKGKGKQKSVETTQDKNIQAVKSKLSTKQESAKGIGKYIISKVKDVYVPTEEFKQATNSIEKIRKYSSIYSEIISKCLSEPGICYIYSELLFGSGLITLAMCFESMGVTRFNETRTVFAQKGNSIKKRDNYCGEVLLPTITKEEITTNKRKSKGKEPVSTSTKKERELRIQPKLRYGLITSETDASKDDVLKEILRSYENRHGDYVKIILGSKLIRDGLNLSNVRQIHLPSMWTPSGLYQALQRGIRATSHVDLLKESKTKHIDVKVYRHAAVTSKSISVDLDLFNVAEKKDREILAVRRFLKQVAVDCQINYARNVRPEDKDNSATCDYQECDYVCVDPAPKKEDVSTYRLLYAEEPLNRINGKLHEIFGFITSIRIDELVYTRLKDEDELLVYEALRLAVQTAETFQNKFGELSCLKIQDGTVFISPFFAGNLNSVFDSYYRSVLIVNEPLLSSGVVAIKSQTSRKGKEKLVYEEETETATQTRTEKEAENESEDTSFSGKIRIIENALLKTKRNLTTEEQELLDRYKNYIYYFREPTAELKQEQDLVNQRGKGRGRKPKENKIVYRNEPLFDDVKGNIIVHSLYTIPLTNISYNIISVFMKAKGRLRIYNQNESIGWRDTTISETPVYNALIRGRIQTILKPYNDAGVYGTVLSDNEFRIHGLPADTEKEKKNRKDSEKSDERGLQRGRICTKSSDNLSLLNLMYDLGIRMPQTETDVNTLTKAQLVTYVLNKYNIKDIKSKPIEYLKFIYVWDKSNISRPNICNEIRTHFESNDLLFIA